MSISILFFVLTIIIFFFDKRIIVSLVSFFVLSYFINVLFVELIFEKSFSNSMFYIDNITKSLMILLVTFYLFSKEIKFNEIKLKSKITSHEILLSLFFIGTILYQIINFNFGYDGGYKDNSTTRNSIIDYLVLINLCMLYLSKFSRILFFQYLIILFVFLLEGERQKLVVMAIPAILPLVRNNKFFKYYKILMIFGYFILTILSFLRAPDSNNRLSELHVTTDAGVTISSTKVIDFGEKLDIQQKILFTTHLLLGNIIPTSFLPRYYNMKLEVANQYNIPGGSYYVSYLYALYNYFGVFIGSLLIVAFGNYFNRFNSNRNHFLYAIFLGCSFRWFLYSPYAIASFVVVALFLITIFNNRYIKQTP